LRVTGAVTHVLCPQALGHQQLDALADELLARIAEHALGLGIDQRNAALRADDHHGIRRSLQQAAETLLGTLALADVAADGGGADDLV
jgi:hypothetical protein